MVELWARSLAHGVDDSVFWASTPSEVRVLLDAYATVEQRRQRADYQRAGLIAAAVYNVHRKKGTPKLNPMDFWDFGGRAKNDTPDALRGAMLAWARAENRRRRA